MAGKSWDFRGESKDWDNAWEHNWIRSKLVVGWSAAEGGPAASSHGREEATQTYLRRPCVMNPKGGPQGMPDTDMHEAKATLSLAYVDAERRKEFHRRKYNAEIKERLGKLKYTQEIQHNLGYPFNQGMVPREIKKKEKNETPEEKKAREEYELMAKLHPEAKTSDFDKEWDREPLGKIAWKSEEEAKVDPYFHSWLGLPIGWQDGYFEVRDLATVGANATPALPPAELESDVAKLAIEDDKLETSSKTSKEGSKGDSKTSKDGSKAEAVQEDEEHTQGPVEEGTKFVWHGPEEDPRWLDVCVWKPLNLIGPVAVKNAGAVQTVSNLAMGRPKAPPRELLPKRTFLREETYPDHIKGGTQTIKYNSNVLFERNIHTTDWLTGATIYKFDQRAQTKTSIAGHGILDKKELIRRKDTKAKALEKEIGDLDSKVVREAKIIKKVEDNCLAGKMTVDTGRNKVKEAEEKIKTYSEQKQQLVVRLEIEAREIKALKYELEVKHIARDLPIPKEIVKIMDPKQLESIANLNYQLNPVRKLLHVPELQEDADAYIEEESDDDDGLNLIGLFFKEKKEQSAEGAKKGEKYFGQSLVDPASGKLNIPIVKRKNADTVLKAKEEAKAIADVYLARTQGKPLLARPNAEQKKTEKKQRANQQKFVDSLMTGVLNTDPLEDLELWAKSQVRRSGVFGSSAFPATTKPHMETVQIDQGQYMSYEHLTKGSALGNKTSAACSSGKVVGCTNSSLRERSKEKGKKPQYHTAFQTKEDVTEYQLKGWGPERGDQWAIGKALADTYGKQCRSADSGITPNVSFVGRAAKRAPGDEPLLTQPNAKIIVEHRDFNGSSKK